MGGMVYCAYSQPVITTGYDMRQCLALITSRESELAAEEGRNMDMRPRYIDEPKDTVVVPIDKIGIRKKEDDS